jgi:nucleoside-diphosphate-sugar epimerase
MAQTRPDRSGQSALVVGGTGPTGPDIVRGLLARGFDTAIFHSGTHEVPLPHSVKHIHGDAHFPETIAAALGDATFDVVVVQYGRLRHLIDHFRHRAGHVVAIGGSMSPLAGSGDSRWGDLGRPALVREQDRHLIDDPECGRFGFRVAEASELLLAAGERGDFVATYIAYPSLFGPRQPGCVEWAIVRRLLDSRRRLILPDGGLRLESRGFVHNVSQAPLLAIDQPSRAAGRSYVVTDRDVFTMRQRVEYIARQFDIDVEIVDMPFDLATPAHPLYRIGPAHRVAQGEAIREELGYVDLFDAGTALRMTVQWLVGADRPEIEELEEQLGDSFDYAFEDRLIEWWIAALGAAPVTTKTTYRYSHPYRHPREPAERSCPLEDRGMT